MSTLTQKQVEPFMIRWTSDEITDSGVHKIGRYRLQYTPDTLHLGNGTHPVAIKNREANFMVIPDFQSLKLGVPYNDVESRLTYCWTPRKELVRVEPTADNPDGDYVWQDLPGKVWPIAPVDVLCPTLQSCDLAILQHRSRTVLERWTDTMLRRYAGANNTQGGADGLAREWEELVGHFTSLGMTMSEAKRNKRSVTIAKLRLTRV
jgi:hypothetical protein